MSLSADQFTYARMLLADPGSSAIQAVLVSGASGGTFTLTFDGQTTSALAYNAGANAVQNALAALSNIGLGNVSVNSTLVNSTSDVSYAVYFLGDLGNVAQPMLTADISGLTPITASVTVSLTAMGGVMAFSDSDLNLLMSQAGENFYLMISYAFQALLGDLSRLHDYVAGQSQEKMSQVYNHVKEQAEHYQEWALAQQQVQFVGLRSVPPRVRAVPITSGVPATSLQYGPPNRSGPWGRRGNWGGE
jgi:hypothetical protein